MHFSQCNGLKVIWTQSWKKWMSWKFNWIILAQIFCIGENRFLISHLEKKVIRTWNFFLQKSYPSGEKNYLKKMLHTTFFIFWILFRGGTGLQFLFSALLNAFRLKLDIVSQTLEIFKIWWKIDLFWEATSRNQRILIE